MFSFLRPQKLPLLDPSNYPKIELVYQNKLWENHPYFFCFTWEGQDQKYSALSSFNKNLMHLSGSSKGTKSLKLKLIGKNNQKLKNQYLLYLDISVHRMLDNLKLRAEELKKYWIKNEKVNPFLPQTEEQNYGWLEGTLNVLTRAIENKIKDPEYLLQYEIQFSEDENEGFLKIQSYNLYFDFSVRDYQIHVLVIDSKNSKSNEKANRYDLVFLEQFPRVIDLITKYFKYLRDNTKIDVIP